MEMSVNVNLKSLQMKPHGKMQQMLKFVVLVVEGWGGTKIESMNPGRSEKTRDELAVVRNQGN